MNDLPPEILSSIVDVLFASVPHQHIASYASISRKWQVAVEERTFRIIKTTSSRLEEFSTRFAGSNVYRRSILRKVELSFELPALPQKGGCSFKSAPNRELDCSWFSDASSHLLMILTGFRTPAVQGVPNIHVAFLQEYRASDCKHEHSDRAREEMWTKHGLYNIAHLDAYPVVRGVSQVTFGEPHPSHYLKGLSPHSSIELLSRFVDLETVKLGFQDSYTWGLKRRIQHRDDVASGLRTLRHRKLREIECFVRHEPQGNETLPVPHLYAHDDPLVGATKSMALLPQLTKLHLTGSFVIRPTIFDEMLQGEESVLFPQLRDFLLEFSFETADGRRYFKQGSEYEPKPSDPRQVHDNDTDRVAIYGDEPKKIGWIDCEYICSLPNEETVYPLLLGVARAARRFLKLQKMTLRMNSDGDGWNEYDCDLFRDFGIQFLKSNTPVASKFVEDFIRVPDERPTLHQNRLYWRVLEWRPDQHVEEEWRRTLGP